MIFLSCLQFCVLLELEDDSVLTIFSIIAEHTFWFRRVKVISEADFWSLFYNAWVPKKLSFTEYLLLCMF